MNNIKKFEYNFFDIFAFSFLLLIPFLSFLKFNQYNFLATEVFVLGFVLIISGLLCFSVYKFSSWAIKLVIFAILITLSFSFFSSNENIGLIFLIFVSSLILFMLFSNNSLTILSIFSLVFLASIIFLPMKKQLSDPVVFENKPISNNAKLPLILYIILDEHAGFQSLKSQSLEGKQINQTLQDFYLNSGFKIYTDAYSHYPSTENSLPNLFNFSLANKDNYYFSNPENLILKQNKFFEILTNQGYNIRIYQPDFIDYSKAENSKIAACYTYPAFSMKAINEVSINPQDRLLLLTKGFLLQSSVYRIIFYTYQYKIHDGLVKAGLLAPEWTWYQARVSSLNMPEVFARLKADILAHPTGSVFFAHILAPHNPYVYDANCKLLPAAEWQVTRGPVPINNTVLTRNQRYAIYDGQLLCVQKQLQELFSSLKQAGIYDQAIIIIHGDHGSRIALHGLKPELKNQLTQQDFRDYYQTLFVTKIPNQLASYDSSFIDLQTVLAETVYKITGQKFLNNSFGPYVFLYPQNHNDILAEMSIKDFK